MAISIASLIVLTGCPFLAPQPDNNEDFVDTLKSILASNADDIDPIDISNLQFGFVEKGDEFDDVLSGVLVVPVPPEVTE